MTRKTQRILRKCIPYISVALIAALVIGGVVYFTKPEETPAPPESGSEAPVETSSETVPEEPTETLPPETEETETEESTEEPSSSSTEESEEFPTVPALEQLSIDALVDRYYKARIEDDADTLNEIVDSERQYDTAELINETKFINRYDHFSTYIIPGLEEDYYIVYVTYDIYFNGIDTGAPALNHYVVKRDEEGTFRIVDRVLSEEFENYIEDTEESETVRKLRSQVNIKLQKACDGDPDLAYLMSLLNGNLDREEEGN